MLSTGRCGTQWIASSIDRFYAGLVDVEHEPLHSRYEPRRMLGIGDCRGDTLPAPVQRHIDELVNRDRRYLECGHPSWSSIPVLHDHLGERMRVIHLVRHPVPTALSWLTHSAYQPPLAPHLDEKILLSPFDVGVRLPEYRDSWHELSPFEKCVYYWCEVTALALEVRQEFGKRWLTLRYEDLFGGDGVESLLGFLELPANDAMTATRSLTSDAFCYVTRPGHDWHAIVRCPHAREIAAQFSYDIGDVDNDAMHRRYVLGLVDRGQ